jgi:photosynthetic reaction center cytochrome c subunit
MKLGRWGRILLAAGAAGVYLFGVASAVGVPVVAEARQASLTSDTHFKNVQLLKGLPIDTFFDVMGMFAASMGGDCTYCHSKDAVFSRDAFAIATPRLQRARQMIVMMQTLNKSYFGGAPRVNCFTCHRGAYTPETAPRLALQYGTPDEDPNMMSIVPDTRTPVDQVFNKYLEAIGGAARVAKITSFAGKGTYSGFDTGFDEFPVELFARAPDQRATVARLSTGQSVKVFDGRNGWLAGPDSPAPLVTLTEGNLELARIEAMVAFPAGIKQFFSEWQVGSSAIDGRFVYILQGRNPGQPPVNLYFDEAGLLVRLVRWNVTPFGPVPTQIDYADYREVAGVKVPFTWTTSQTYMQSTIKLTDLQANIAIDPARFARPAPAAR